MIKLFIMAAIMFANPPIDADNVSSELLRKTRQTVKETLKGVKCEVYVEDTNFVREAYYLYSPSFEKKTIPVMFYYWFKDDTLRVRKIEFPTRGSINSNKKSVFATELKGENVERIYLITDKGINANLYKEQILDMIMQLDIERNHTRALALCNRKNDGSV